MQGLAMRIKRVNDKFILNIPACLHLDSSFQIQIHSYYHLKVKFNFVCSFMSHMEVDLIDYNKEHQQHLDLTSLSFKGMFPPFFFS